MLSINLVPKFRKNIEPLLLVGFLYIIKPATEITEKTAIIAYSEFLPLTSAEFYDKEICFHPNKRFCWLTGRFG